MGASSQHGAAGDKPPTLADARLSIDRRGRACDRRGRACAEVYHPQLLAGDEAFTAEKGLGFFKGEILWREHDG